MCQLPRAWLVVATFLSIATLPSFALATTHVVTFVCCQYTPSNFQAMVGDTVEWQGDFASHPLQSTTIPPGASAFSNSSGFSFSYLIEVPGTYDYHCTVHQPSMAGSFDAQGGGGLVGTKTIPGDYPNIASAFADLDTQGVGTGGVTFNVAAGHTETSSNLVIAITNNPPTAANSVVFQKSGTGSNPLITAAPGDSSALDGIVKLSGADYITFDGIDLLDPPSNTGDAMMEWGYALLRADTTDGCQHVVIKNCAVTLQKINVVSSSVFSIGVYVANRNLAGATVNATDPAGQNSYNRFFGNTISNVYRGIQVISTSTARDVDNEVGVVGEAPNTITNFGGGSQTVDGIRCEGQVNVKVNNNAINGGTGSTTFVNGILATLFGATATAPNYEISYNVVTLQGGTTNLQFGIRALATGDTVRVHHNIVENCNIPSSSAEFRVLTHEPSGRTRAAYIHDNIVRNNTHTGTGTLSLIYVSGPISKLQIYANEVYGNQKTGASGNLYCIRVDPDSGSSACYSNTIYDNSIPTSSGTSAASVYGYNYVGGTGPVGAVAESVYNNIIYNLSVGGSSTSTSSVTYGIYSVPGLSSNTVAKSIYGNTIYGFSSSVGTVGGIFQQYGSTSRVHENTIYNLSTQTATTTNYAAGIIVAGALGTAATTVYNNFISDIRAPNSPNSNGVIGINATLSASNSSVAAYYNTIFLNAAPSGSNFGSSGISSVGNATATTASLDLRNNIIVNVSTPSGTGLATVLRRTNTNLANYSSNSNNNSLYSGTPSANHLIFYDGTNSDQTLGDYQARVAPRDSASISVLPPFVNDITAPFDLHIIDSVVTPIDSGGTPVAGITTDFDGDPRDATYPDIGADEFGGSNIVTICFPISIGWNLVSLPVRNPVPDDSISHLFPCSVFLYGFDFSGGYVQRYTMVPGRGYWIKCDSAGTVCIAGTPIDTLTIPVANNWNIIGSISTSIDTSAASVTPNPPNLRASNFFKYSFGYSVASTIDPGSGYWVKANSAGFFFMHATGPAWRTTGAPAVGRAIDELNSLTIRDANGGSQTLHFGNDPNGEVRMGMFAMPPAPPEGSFDARFESSEGGTMVQTHASEITAMVEMPIAIQSSAYPLMVSWKVNGTDAAYELSDGEGGIQPLRGEGTLRISNSEVTQLMLRVTGSGSGLPKEFALYQNYPNPFNPTTSIRFALPVESKVSAEIYNVLGQHVATLINDLLPAGYHIVEWNGTGVSGQTMGSGIYFVRLSAEVGGKKFSEVRKLMLLK